jgi:hypothetical protein
MDRLRCSGNLRVGSDSPVWMIAQKRGRGTTNVGSKERTGQGVACEKPQPVVHGWCSSRTLASGQLDASARDDACGMLHRKGKYRPISSSIKRVTVEHRQEGQRYRHSQAKGLRAVSHRRKDLALASPIPRLLHFWWHGWLWRLPRHPIVASLKLHSRQRSLNRFGASASCRPAVQVIDR